MCQCLLLFSFILSVLFLNAQSGDSTHYRLRYGISGMINTTNDGRSFILNNALSFDIKKSKTGLNSSSSWIYGRQKEGLLNNDFNTGVNFDWLKDVQRLYFWGLTNFTSSYSLKVRYQFQTGAGIGYNFINTRNAELVVSDGILYEAGDLKTENAPNDVYQAFRNSLRLKLRWKVNELVSLEGTHFWQPSLASLDDYIIRSSSGASIAMKKWLNINLNLVYNKLSRTNRENFMINVGMVAERIF